MPKNTAQEITLIDQEGQEWARATLSLTRLNALLREYKKQGIHLTPRERVSA
jgi:uncharacterized protein YrzB (UPF0473 family)